MRGIPVVVNLHNSLWPNGCEPKPVLARLLLKLNGWFFRGVAAAAAGVSPECQRQVRLLAGSALPFFQYRIQYREAQLRGAPSADNRNPFRVIFVGRAERNKGVLDIAAIAEATLGSSVPILFEVCGGGSALPELEQIISEKGLGAVVRVHGRIPPPELLQVYLRAHAVIVPTRSDFCEGLPGVCAEAVLFGLPIVTSRLSNAIVPLGPAILEVEPENIAGYAQAVQILASDRTVYDQLSSACPELAQQFLDRRQSYSAAIDRLIAHLFPNFEMLNDYEQIFARLT